MFQFLIILSAVAMALALAILAARCFGLKRLRLGGYTLTLEKPMALEGERFTRRDGALALLWGLGMLLLSYALSLMYGGIFGEGFNWEGFCDAWQHYDSVHYLGLAEQGYAGYTEGGQPLFLVFFPLYPWLMRLLHLLIPNFALCGHILSALGYLGSCYLLFRLVTEEFGRPVGIWTLLFFSAYPFAFFFAAIYTESLFLFLSLLSFYFIRKHRYPLAGLFGALAALTRMQGVLLALVALVEYAATEHPLQKLRARDWKGLWRDLWGKLIWMAFMGLGVLCYLLLNKAVAGKAFAFQEFQLQRWNQGFLIFTKSLSGLWRAFLNPTEGYEFVPYTTWGPEILLFFLCLGALLYGARRLKPVWLLYFVLCILLNFSLRNPLSCGRYMACAFPLPVLLAMGSQRRPWLGRFLLVSFALVQGLFLLAYFAGKHVC